MKMIFTRRQNDIKGLGILISTAAIIAALNTATFKWEAPSSETNSRCTDFAPFAGGFVCEWGSPDSLSTPGAAPPQSNKNDNANKPLQAMKAHPLSPPPLTLAYAPKLPSVPAFSSMQAIALPPPPPIHFHHPAAKKKRKIK